jgi:hypothetical protein
MIKYSNFQEFINNHFNFNIAIQTLRVAPYKNYFIISGDEVITDCSGLGLKNSRFLVNNELIIINDIVYQLKQDNTEVHLKICPV